MRRRAGADADPLLEDAQLRRAVARRDQHAGFDARAPMLGWYDVDDHHYRPFRSKHVA
jgi:hypothetical protein